MKETDTIVIRKTTIDELPLLHSVARQAYTENFAHHWNEGGLAQYLQQSYSLEGMKSDLTNSDIAYFIAFFRNEPAGFMKLRLNSSGADQAFLSGMEIEKLYFRPPYRGKGIGKRLVDIAVELGGTLQRRTLWLGVIDTNFPAIEFYKKMGFQLFDKTTLDLPYFREELKGMWRMTLELSEQ